MTADTATMSALPMATGMKDRPHMWIITGPAGCGKTTLAVGLKEVLGWPYIEGDEAHPQGNKEKMAKGIPLEDNDRWDWLGVLREQAVDCLKTTGAEGVLVTCSALKKKYRDVLRVAAYYERAINIHFIFLEVPMDQVIQRVQRRTAEEAHYMGSGMVAGQYAIWEPPEHESDAVILDGFGGGGPDGKDKVLAEALKVINERMGK